MTAARDVLDGIRSGMDWVGRKVGVDGLALIALVWTGLLLWRLT